MFELKICDILDAPGIITEWATKALSFVDGPPTSGFFTQPRDPAKHLLMMFEDIARPIPGWTEPSMWHLERVLDFTKDLDDDDRLLIHCVAGVSRSTSMAIAVLIQHGMPWKRAFEAIERIRPCLWPNNLIVRFTDEKFGLNGKYIDFVAAGKGAQRKAAQFAEPSQEDIDAMKRLQGLFENAPTSPIA